MNLARDTFRLLLVGIGPRLGVSALITTFLWLCFMWATSTPGAL